MEEPEQMVALGWAFREKHFVLRFHAHFEMLEGLAVGSIGEAGTGSELLEDYSTRREGHTKLLLGYVGGDAPVHIVVNVSAFESDWSEPLVVVTVYEPEGPGWIDERTRRVEP